MKKTRTIERKLNATVIATLCAVAVGCLTARAQYAPNSPPSQPDTTTAPGQPRRVNKCSQLIGMTVQNPRGDKLGKIDEVVVDFNNGRVSYCVLSVEHGIFATPKYLAVPTAAFRPSADGSYLILNADKDKVAQAQGFDRNDWPPVNNPAWGAQPFWQTSPRPTITSPPDQDKNMPSETTH